jgi:integration host factor subunit beta
MIKSELVKILNSKFPELSNEDVSACVAYILAAITNSVANNNRVELRGFGTFSGSLLKDRIHRNPQTGEKVWVEGKLVPRFRPSKFLINRLNQSKMIVESGKTSIRHTKVNVANYPFEIDSYSLERVVNEN